MFQYFYDISAIIGSTTVQRQKKQTERRLDDKHLTGIKAGASL